MTDDAELDRLEEAGLIVWANQRYGARYAIDRPGLDKLVSAGLIPVVHAGQPQVIDAVRSATPDLAWTVVQLTCDRDTAETRIIARRTGDVAERLAARAATPTIDADLTIDTGTVDPNDAANRIDSVI
ncbi:kinase [Nocardia salmonicida]|uniref:Kinase n=1 Tax=Nocardia salmonicida TaxID=53431 RepID=A0ABZ1NBI4_9NOCA